MEKEKEECCFSENKEERKEKIKKKGRIFGDPYIEAEGF